MRQLCALRRPAATYPLGEILRPPAPVSVPEKRRALLTIATALIAHGFAATPLMTIGVTYADITSNSAVDDDAADQGMDCT